MIFVLLGANGRDSEVTSTTLPFISSLQDDVGLATTSRAHQET